MTLREEILKNSNTLTEEDKIWDNTKSFFTSWAKQFGYKLTPESMKAFEDTVYKTIVYNTTKYILQG